MTRDVSRRAFFRAAGLAVAAMSVGVPVTGVAAQGATPAATPDSGRLAPMLALAPAAYPWVENPGQLIITFADIAAQLEVTGVRPPDTMDDPGFAQWSAATRALAMPANATQYLNFWRQDYGFDLLQTDQTLEVNLAPFNLSLFRGRFDLDVVRATLTANGYREIEVAGYTLLSLRDDYEIDVTSPFAYKMAAMNHAAVLADGTLAFSSVEQALVAVLDIDAGRAPSLMELAGFAAMAEQAPSELVSATIVDGTTLAGDIPATLLDLEPGATPDIGAIATEMARPNEMPPVTMVLVGSTAGGPLIGEDIDTPAGVSDAHAVAVALMLTPEAADAAVPVIEDRLKTGELAATGQPLADLFPEHDVRAVPSKPVLVIDLTLGPETPPTILMNMLFSRDLDFLGW